MFRSLVVHGAVALATLAFAVPVGVAVVDDTAPDETVSASDDTVSVPSASPTSGPASSVADDAAGSGPPPGDVDFQVDMILGLVPEDEMNAYFEEQNERQELAIQACMNDAGFEYNIQATTMFEDPLGEYGTVEYAEQWGYGVYTTMDPETSPYANMDEEFVWPNQEIVDALSSAEQNAWFEVNNRCSQDAYVTDDPYRNPMVQQALEDFENQVEADPRMRAAQDAWVDCMEEAGHPFAAPEEIFETIYDEDLQQQFFDSEAWKPSSEDHAEYLAMVETEIGIAVADATCSPALQDAREEVVADLRPALVDVWQTIDWSLPPETYPGEGDFGTPGETIVVDDSMVPGDSVVDASVVDGTVEPGADTTEAPVGLDLSEPTDTTEPS